MSPTRSLAALALVLVSCRSVGWEGGVQRWGSVVEVMRDGKTESRVRVIDAASGPDVVGVGALAGLEGEVTILDGSTWTSRSDGHGKATTVHGNAADQRATLLITANITEWVEIPINADADVRQIAALTGINTAEWDVVPFVVTGHLEDLRSHIVHGACPNSSAATGSKAPLRRDRQNVIGKLVGFWTRDTSGTVAHPGETLHVHAIVEGTERFTSHVEGVRIGAGSIVRVPRQQTWIMPTNAGKHML